MTTTSSDDLKEEGQWCLYDDKVFFELSGEGIDSLKANLPDDGCKFAVIRISPSNMGNTGSDIKNHQNIILQWKGPSAKAMKKVKFNGQLQNALDSIEPNNGYVEVLGKVALTIENLIDRVSPGPGSKVIEEDD